MFLLLLQQEKTNTVARRIGENKVPDCMLNDRERILTEIIYRLYLSKPLIVEKPACFDDAYWKKRNALAYFSLEEPQKGDLVLVTSGPRDKFAIAWYEHTTAHGFLVRAIGEKAYCEWTNATAVPIRGLDHIVLLEGAQRTFYRRLKKIFDNVEFYAYRFGGLRFDGKIVHVTIREAHARTPDSTPFTISFPWSATMTRKKIREALIKGGYGTRGFAPE